MRLAVCLPGPSLLGDRVRLVLPGLGAGLELSLFGEGERPLAELLAKDHDRILVPIADDAVCVPFMPVLYNLGGIVWLHDWSLRSLATAVRPSLNRGGLLGRLAGLREGGLAGLRGDPSCPLNRPVVRFGDAFVVHDEATRLAILHERNAPTPARILEDDSLLGEIIRAMPPHRTNRRSLISGAIDASDRAREARRLGED